MAATLTKPIVAITLVSGGKANVTVTGEVQFQAIDRELMKLGLVHNIRCGLVGEDVSANPNDPDDNLRIAFDPTVIRLTGAQPETVRYEFNALNVSRSVLDEDPDAGDVDELFALVRLNSNVPVALQTAASDIIRIQLGKPAAA